MCQVRQDDPRWQWAHFGAAAADGPPDSPGAIHAASIGETPASAELRMSVVLDFLVAERAGSHRWRLGGRVLGVPVKGQPV